MGPPRERVGDALGAEGRVSPENGGVTQIPRDMSLNASFPGGAAPRCPLLCPRRAGRWTPRLSAFTVRASL
ncbi:hypothetical protein NDU88_002078 [Pleurodeles waltl]|uniref:Uncharacterized protein n=1 Tax=Pleurodeles waltl TaxID=8319 RepID=A0AAV7MUM1_PLEWA|nr:hypothetical protein NDU88_002078 [Pleurodeles waltl]